MAWLGKLRKFFKKEKPQIETPYEFGLALHTEEGRKYGIFENFTKEIRHYEGKEYMSLPYLKSVIESMEDLGIPTHNIAQEQLELPIMKKIEPNKVEYAN